MLFLFLLSYSFVHAQIDGGWDWDNIGDEGPEYPGVFITKDFVNCGTGLKDSTGKWIVEPTYTYISHLSGPYYLVFLGIQRGVADARNGQIVVPPIYNGVRSYHRGNNQCFEIYIRKKGYGVVDSTGKTILPVMYKEIGFYPDGTIAARKSGAKWTMYPLHGEPFRLQWKTRDSPDYADDSLFTVSKTFLHLDWWWLPSKCGLIDNHGKIIFRRKYEGIIYSGGQYHFARLERKKSIAYARLDGTIVFEGQDDDPVERHTWTGNSALRLNSSGYVPLKVNGKWGIVAASGDTILPFVYDNISHGFYRNARQDDVFIVQKDSVQGTYSVTERKWLLDPVYSMLNDRAAFTNEKDSSQVVLFLARRDHHYGIILSTGQELLPFRYTNYDYLNGELLLWNEQENPVIVTLPGTYRSHLISRQGYSRSSSERNVETIPADNRFAEKSFPDGTKIFYTPSLVNDSTQRAYYRRKDEDAHINMQTYDSLLHATAIVVVPVKPLHAFTPGTGIYAYPSQSILISNGEDTSYIYHVSGSRFGAYISAALESQDSLHRYYSYTTDYAFSRRPWFFRKRLGLVRDDGLQVVPPGSVYNIHPVDQVNGVQRFVISAWKSTNDGLVDGNGKMLMDTIYPSINYVHGNYALVGAMVKKRNSGFHHRGYEYNVIDLRSGEKLLPVKRTSRTNEWPNDVAIVTKQPEGYVLFNLQQRRFVNGRGYIHMRQLDEKGNYYSVKTCSSKIGVIDANGKLVIDTVYSAMMFGDYEFRRNDSASEQSSYYTLYNDQSHLIFNADQGRMVADSAVRREWLNNALQNTRRGESDIFDNRDVYCPALSVDSVGSLQRIPLWAQEVIFDSMIHPVRYIPDTSWWYKGATCEYCSKETYFTYTWTKDYEKAGRLTVVEYASDSCLSVFRLRMGYRSMAEYIRPELFYNTLLYPDGPHPVVLDSLFKGTEWRKFITGFTMDYLSSHLHVDGNCSNPYMFPVMMKDHFLITKDGLLLYPPGYLENGRPLHMLLTWEQLKPYLREDVKTKLGVK